MAKRRGKGEGEEKLEIKLPEHLATRLRDFCTEQKIDPSTVVARALEEYFHMGDVAH